MGMAKFGIGYRRIGFGVVILLLALMVLMVWLRTPPDKPPSNQTVATTELAPLHSPVVYEVSDFEQSSYDTKAWLSILGATATRESALDFYGKTATLYRYHSKHEPMFYAIDSADIFEMVWYYPAAHDTQADKQQAVQFAKQTYGVAKTVLGDNTQGFYETLLAGRSQVLPKGVLFASCYAVMCRLVLEKPMP